MLPQAATSFYALQQRVNQTTVNEIRRHWRRMGDDFDASWRRVGPVALAALVEAQAQMANAALDYVPQVLKQTDIPDRPEGDFKPESLVGIASDGRRLDNLAYGAVIEAKTAVGNGSDAQQALAQGGNWMDLMVKLQIADAARQAVGIMTASRKNLAGQVRVLNPPSCQRCAILAGRFYKWDAGFDRHPRCDCTGMPTKDLGWAKAEGFITDPMDAYRQGHIRDLTDAQKFAIDNGADISQVVNAHRGMSTTATRRIPRKGGSISLTNAKPFVAPGMPDLLGGIKFAQPTSEAGILTPEGIYQQAKTRDEAIAMLRQYGYII